MSREFNFGMYKNQQYNTLWWVLLLIVLMPSIFQFFSWSVTVPLLIILIILIIYVQMQRSRLIETELKRLAGQITTMMPTSTEEEQE